MTKYRVGGAMEIGVTPAVSVTVAMSNLAVALILAEGYQRTDQRQKAIELLESLGAEAPGEPVFALSLADLYFEGDQWDDVVRVTEGVQANEDDATLKILAFRAYALSELGMTEAALALTKECLRTKKWNPALLRFARYIRGRAYESAGKASMARKEYEKVYAEDASYADVAERLGQKKPRASTSATPPRPDGGIDRGGPTSGPPVPYSLSCQGLPIAWPGVASTCGAIQACPSVPALGYYSR